MHIKLTAAEKTDVGKQREQNEDSVFTRIETLTDGDRGLFIVADGMGGYQAGEVASKLAVDTISRMMDSFFNPLADESTIELIPPAVGSIMADVDETIKIPRKKSKIQEKVETETQGEIDPAETVKKPQKAIKPQQEITPNETEALPSINDRLTEAIQEANRVILHYGEQQTNARGMGCTVTMAFIQNEQAYIANVGDSRTYLLRNGKLDALTRDHSLVARLVESKQIEPDDIYSHPQRNLIYRSLGAGRQVVEVDVFPTTLQPNDILFLCSDGLWEMVRHQDLLKELSGHSSPQQICDTLINLANAHGGVDNITAIVVKVNTP
jgi:serine/threonine protein phosphatase PrpC